MGCGCGGKRGPVTLLDGSVADGNPVVWGPVMWAVLHIFAERIGKSGVPSVDTDQARDFTFLINLLPAIIPCRECQAHSRTYLATHPFQIQSLLGNALSIHVRTWFLTFHNTVRESKGQSIDITTLEQLATLYSAEKIQTCQIQTIISNVAYGIRTGIVKQDNWKRWYVYFNRLKVLLAA
jgi:Erv1 / Alr family